MSEYKAYSRGYQQAQADARAPKDATTPSECPYCDSTDPAVRHHRDGVLICGNDGFHNSMVTRATAERMAARAYSDGWNDHQVGREGMMEDAVREETERCAKKTDKARGRMHRQLMTAWANTIHTGTREAWEQAADMVESVLMETAAAIRTGGRA